MYSVECLATSNRTKFLVATLVVYIGVVFAFTIVPTHITGFRNPRSYHVNVIPLGYSFTCFLQDPYQHPHITTFCLRNTLGNLALFVPLGILLPLVSNRFLTFKRVLLFALFLSLSVESIQFLLRFFGNPRAVDIDDVILNTLGACVGFAIYKSFIPSYVARHAVESVETRSGPLDGVPADAADSEKL
jgi:glycopeptide antibiotics resistance protein